LLLVGGLLGSLALTGTAFAQAAPVPVVGRGPGSGPIHAGMAHSGIFGKVTAISGDTLTVTSTGRIWPGGPMRPATTGTPTPTPTPSTTTYTVNASGATVTKNGTASTLSAIAVGDTVIVQGTVSGTTVTATAIRDGVFPGIPGAPKGPKPTPVIQGNGEPVIAGTISAMNGDTLTVSNKSNITYTVDATNATISVKNAKSTLSAVSVGDNVVVQGTVNGTAVTASSVIDQGAAKTSASGSGSTSGTKGMGGFFGSIGSFFKKIFGF
jgi:type V secretory pathway adhesin AidA